jgi:ubiquinone/menaquinone biosynthesis C-methylase UbiE
MSVERRVTDYDRIADRFDARYSHYSYDGVRETLLNFLGPQPSSVLEVGCGTGHWLAVAQEARLKPSPYNDNDGAKADSGSAKADNRSATAENRSAKALAERPILAGVDPSAPMLDRARVAAPSARLIRARAEDLPWRDAAFDRIFCVNALHHFADRARFFAEARRVLKPGGALLTIGSDPHTDRDDWWVYQYFEETRAIDLERFARVRTLRGEMALAGFAWTESMEADHIEVLRPAAEALTNGIVDRGLTSQLTVLSDEEFSKGVERVRQADAAAGGELQLVADIRLYATIGWVGP